MAKVLDVKVISGSNLLAADRGGTSDPYVILKLGKETKKTKVIKKTLNPEWNFRVTFRDFNPDRDELQLFVYDKDTFKRDDKLGKCAIQLDSLPDGVDFTHSYPLEGEGIDTGEIKVTLKAQNWGKRPGSVQQASSNTVSKETEASKYPSGRNLPAIDNYPSVAPTYPSVQPQASGYPSVPLPDQGYPSVAPTYASVQPQASGYPSVPLPSQGYTSVAPTYVSVQPQAYNQTPGYASMQAPAPSSGAGYSSMTQPQAQQYSNPQATQNYMSPSYDAPAQNQYMQAPGYASMQAPAPSTGAGYSSMTQSQAQQYSNPQAAPQQNYMSPSHSAPAQTQATGYQSLTSGPKTPNPNPNPYGQTPQVPSYASTNNNPYAN